MVSVALSAYSGEPPEGAVREAERFVDELAASGRRPVFFLGGYRGLMKVAADLLLEAGFTVVFVIPVEYEELEHPSKRIVVRTGMSFKGRNTVMVRSGDALVALGGGAGTIMEIFAAYGEGRRVFLLTGHGLPSDRLAEAYPEGRISREAPPLISYHRDGRSLAKALVNHLDSLQP